MPPQHETEAFCLALKSARQRRGLKLEQIAEATKVCVSYYAALEANDLRHWPKGLFRRSFFRGYITAIGLPVDEMISDFVRLFPEDDRAAASVSASPESSSCRLVLDESWHGIKAPIGARLVNAAVDGGVIGAISVAAAWVASSDFSIAAAVTAVTYFTLATLLLGETPAAWVRRWVPTGESPPDTAAELAVQDGGPDDREWVSDARRVRPRDTPARLRVRFKTSA